MTLLCLGIDDKYYNMEEYANVPERLYYRLYVSYIQASRELLQKVNKQSYYRIQVWENDKLIGEMMEGSSPAILSDKIFLTKAAVNFSQRFEGKEIVIKLSQYYNSSQTLLGIGMFSLNTVKKKYAEQSQRFYSLLEASLSSTSAQYKLIFSLFVEKDKYALDQYVKRFKENEKDVMRAKRNINIYKKEMLNKSIQREREGPPPFQVPQTPRIQLGQYNQNKNNDKIEKEVKYARSEGKEKILTQNKQLLKPLASPMLQINSAAKFHTKAIQKKQVKERKPLNEAEQKQFQAYSTIMEEFKADSHFISALDMQTPSVISDGSEQSEMKFKHEKQTYSEKAIKKFKGNVSIFFNVLFVIVAILLIAFVITPSRKYTKSGRIQRKNSHAQE